MVQSVLLFVVDTWMVTPHMDKVLWGFQIQVEIQMMGQIPRSTPDGKWRYTSALTAREEAGFLTMEGHRQGFCRL